MWDPFYIQLFVYSFVLNFVAIQIVYMIFMMQLHVSQIRELVYTKCIANTIYICSCKSHQLKLLQLAIQNGPYCTFVPPPPLSPLRVRVRAMVSVKPCFFMMSQSKKGGMKVQQRLQNVQLQSLRMEMFDYLVDHK